MKKDLLEPNRSGQRLSYPGPINTDGFTQTIKIQNTTGGVAQLVRAADS